jgi:hypothetical protein
MCTKEDTSKLSKFKTYEFEVSSGACGMLDGEVDGEGDGEVDGPSTSPSTFPSNSPS